jgi:hypothetical protein
MMHSATKARRFWLMPLLLALSTGCGSDAPDPGQPSASLREGLMSADLSITGTVGNTADPRDYTLTYTISNGGNADASNVEVIFLVPQGVAVNTLGGTNWSCNSGSQGINCTTLTLAAWTQSQITADLLEPYGQINAAVTATVQSDAMDPTPADNSVALVLPGDAQTLHLVGGGFGCSLVHCGTANDEPTLILFAGLLGLVSLRRRRAAGKAA